MRGAEWVSHPDRIWRLTTPTGDVLAEIWHDDVTDDYLGRKWGSPFRPLSRDWGEAKAKCEALLAPKGKRKK